MKNSVNHAHFDKYVGKCQESCKRSYIISERACVGCVGELHTCTQLVRNVVEFSSTSLYHWSEYSWGKGLEDH
jgi:hypothetical protein